MLGVAVNLDGAAYLSAPHLTGSETVTSYGGTAVPTIAAGKVTFTAGNLWDLVLSDGSRYPFAERAGIKIHDVSGNGNHAWIESAPASLWETPDNDFLWELDYGANPVLYCDGSGSLQVASPSQSLTDFTIAARVNTAKPAKAIVSEFHEALEDRSHAEHDLTGIDLRNSWQWIVQTFTSNTGTIYVNDVAGAIVATTTTSPTFSEKWFSAMGSADNPFLMSRLLAFSRVLSSGELTALFSADTIPASGKILDYVASHSTADPIQDRSSANNGGAGMVNIPIVNVPALAAKNSVDAMGDTVLNPSVSRVAIAHEGDFPPYEEPLTIRGNAGERRFYLVRSRNFEQRKQASPEVARVVQVQF